MKFPRGGAGKRRKPEQAQGIFPAPSHEILSDREYQVLRLIGSGKKVSEIAEALSLSVKTVSTYRAHILDKMKLRNNAEPKMPVSTL